MKEKGLVIDDQTVYFKSSTEMTEIKDETVTLVVTSPPYWNVRDYGSDNEIGFNQSYQDYINSLNIVWKECTRVLQPNGKISINVQPLPVSGSVSGFERRVIMDIMVDIQNFFRKNDFFLSGMNFWDKSKYINNVSWGSYPKPTNIATNTSFEQIYTFVKRGKTRKISPSLLNSNLLHKDEWRHWAVRCIWQDISPVIKINLKKENIYGHSAPFPEEIPYRLIRMHTVPGEYVLDPFLGSGTTLKMCHILNRKGIGYEINETFKEKIIDRIKESWDIPFTDSEYITIQQSKLHDIIDFSVKKAVENVAKLDQSINKYQIREILKSTKKDVLNTLKKKGLITKSQKLVFEKEKSD